MSIDELIAVLEADEARSRPFRAHRLRLLIEEYGPQGTRIFPGGLVSYVAFEESRQAFLHGLFVSCTIMSQVSLEHMLAGLFRMAGRDDLDGASFGTLLREALNCHYLSIDEFALFDRLRVLRNPYVHSRPPLHRTSVERRALELDVSVDDVVVEDAELAITALLRLCRRPPFSIAEDGRGDSREDQPPTSCQPA